MHKHTFEQDAYSLFINLSVCMVNGNIPHEFLNVLLFGLDFFFLISASMGQVYEEHKDEDGFLYIAYSGENTFGS